MKKGNKNLFIIFGTTSGIGKAFYEYASDFIENEFILVNRKSVRGAQKNVRGEWMIDLAKSLTKDRISSLRGFFSRQDRHKSINLILNASVIEPIKPIGSADDESLLKACYVNFVNYERIVNAFISSTRHLRTRKKILAISSGAAESANIGLASYCSTKAALEMFIKCLFLEQKKKAKYCVIALRPGVVDTNMQQKIRSAKKENFPQVDAYRKIFKQKRLLKSELVAQKIYSLFKSDQYWSNPVININDIN